MSLYTSECYFSYSVSLCACGTLQDFSASALGPASVLAYNLFYRAYICYLIKPNFNVGPS